MFEGFFTAAGTLILVVGILVLCYFTTRKLGRMQPGGGRRQIYQAFGADSHRTG